MLLGNDHENLQVINAEKVESLKQLKESSESQIESQKRLYTDQIANLETKIESLAIQQNSKDQALITSNLSLQHCQSDLTRKRSQLEALEKSQKVEIDKLEAKVTTLRDEN